jgi:hypothetical protein
VPPMGGDTSDIAVFLVVVAMRFIIPLFIPRFPLPAILAALVIDAADQTIFQQFTNLNLDGYQNYDKALDIFYLTIAFLAVYRNWTNTTAINVARFLWYYRLFGVWLFEVFQERWILFVFPNTFEYFFIAYAAIHTQWDPRRLTDRAVIGLAAFIWIVVKLPQEWWIHIAQNDFTDFMKVDVFGTTPTTSWADAITNRPLVTLALVVAIALVSALAVWAYRKAPQPDWSFRVDVDKPVPPVELPDRPQAPLWFAPPFAEKLLLVGLIAAIYTSVLNLDTPVLRIVAATALIIAASVGVSQALARRGIEWSSLGLQWIVLAVVNSVLIGTYAVLVGGSLNRSLAFFFGLLLTMVIVLYDRFIGQRTADSPPSREQLHLSGAE